MSIELMENEVTENTEVSVVEEVQESKVKGFLKKNKKLLIGCGIGAAILGVIKLLCKSSTNDECCISDADDVSDDSVEVTEF